MQPSLLNFPHLVHGERSFREFIARNLEFIEPGLRPYGGIEECQEFRCCLAGRKRAGFIDILAVDRDGAFVVIECKMSRANAAALGQLIGYVAWVQQHLETRGRRVRGVIVALEVMPFLVLAARFMREVPITVLEYSSTGPMRRLA